MEAIWITVAYALGLLASYAKLPPLVGYLGGGLALYGLGVTGSDLLHDIGHVGVLLLLLTVQTEAAWWSIRAYMYEAAVWRGTHEVGYVVPADRAGRCWQSTRACEAAIHSTFYDRPDL